MVCLACTYLVPRSVSVFDGVWKFLWEGFSRVENCTSVIYPRIRFTVVANTEYQPVLLLISVGGRELSGDSGHMGILSSDGMLVEYIHCEPCPQEWAKEC